MYKKISVLVAMITLLGVVQHAKCKKMFEKTRARVQEKYGAWKEKRQQKKSVERYEKIAGRAPKKDFFGRVKEKPKPISPPITHLQAKTPEQQTWKEEKGSPYMPQPSKLGLARKVHRYETIAGKKEGLTQPSQSVPSPLKVSPAAAPVRATWQPGSLPIEKQSHPHPKMREGEVTVGQARTIEAERKAYEAKMGRRGRPKKMKAILPPIPGPRVTEGERKTFERQVEKEMIQERWPQLKGIQMSQ